MDEDNGQVIEAGVRLRTEKQMNKTIIHQNFFEDPTNGQMENKPGLRPLRNDLNDRDIIV